MFPFWEVVVAPVLEAARVRRIVEIGALRGENTELMLHRLGPDVELHVIDPVPDFDPAEHEHKFAGRYVFHRDLSLNVLGSLPPMDAALVDGDHNWYTVYNELRLLRKVSRSAGAPLPVLILHDVCWPYGRRDLYYAPDTIPKKFRQKWRRTGVSPDSPRVIPHGGGMNPTMCNAEMEGGPRNGVMTALDDFIAEHDKPLRRLVLPIYFGLAIVAEEERLDRQPELRAEFDRLESPDGKDRLLELAERTRIDALMFQHAVYFQRERATDRLADRYLDAVKRGLIDEYYLENELRVSQLAEYAERRMPPDLERVRDPVRHDAEAFRRLRELRRSGTAAAGALPLAGYAYSPLGRVGLDRLHACLDDIRHEHIRGDLADCGAGRGGAGIFLRAYLEAHELTDREVWVADRFRAAADDRVAPAPEDGLAGLRPDLNVVRDGFERFDVLDERTHFLQGDLDATLADAPIRTLALLHIGPGLGASVRIVLERMYPRLGPGAFVVIDDVTEPHVREAVSAFREASGITAVEEGFGASGTTWRTTEPAGTAAPPSRRARAGSGNAPLATPAPTSQCDLSIVIVMYNMRREAMRTLRSLSRTYQRDIDGLDYEVIVVENGSDPDQVLGEELVRGFGPEFRYLDLGPEATPSPAHALNRAIRHARGTALALMIDGAHVLTPGVLHYGMAALNTYEPAVVATQAWYVGPGQQGDVMRAGYDQVYEDQLFGQIEWPLDGYRLFDIGHFVHDRDWFDGVWESNCLFAPRKLLEQVGGFDEAFDMAGGGYTNLDIYERLASSPDVKVVSILGEGSFHQVHGGTTTNLTDPTERRERVFSYGRHFAQLRGRTFSGPEKPIHYVGGFHIDSAKRSRGRRMTAKAFAVDNAKEGPDGPVQEPVPMPADLRDGFIAAYWRTLAWTQTSWLGRTVPNTPPDLLTYQEILTDVRPDWIVETGTGDGGRALFLASICDLLGQGHVVSIAEKPAPDLPAHARITYITGNATAPEVNAQVQEIVGNDPKGLVILGTRGGRVRMRQEFDAYKSLVAPGSYVIVEHTVLNGYPVLPSFGPGPHEAVQRILNLNGEFVADAEREKHSLTFNPAGFLRRIS